MQKIHKDQNSEPLNVWKWQIWAHLESSNLISRKIWVIAKSRNFHTVILQTLCKARMRFHNNVEFLSYLEKFRENILMCCFTEFLRKNLLIRVNLRIFLSVLSQLPLPKQKEGNMIFHIHLANWILFISAWSTRWSLRENRTWCYSQKV